MLPDKLKQGLGNWVDGDRFFDRDREMELFHEYLRDRVSLLLVAPRRIGKTSFMREAARRLSKEIIPLHIDLQKAISPEEAIVELSLACRPYASIWQKAAGAFGDFIAKLDTVKISELSITLRSALNSTNWRQKGDELLAILASAADQAEKPVVIFLDEVPILVNRILKGTDGEQAERTQTADNFMSWLRDNALRHKDHVVFVITGSIGLEPILRTAGLSATVNAFRAFELPPWRDDVAEACILALAREKGFPLPQATAAHMVKRLGCSIPHHVQMYFDHVRSNYILDDASGEVSVEYADAVYEKSMTGLRGHPELMHMEERLRLVLDDNLFTLAITYLTETAVVGRLTGEASASITSAAGATRDQMLETLAILQHDGYLESNNGDLFYVSHLVRDWWKKRFGHGYTPAK